MMKNSVFSLLTAGILSLSAQQVFAEDCMIVNTPANIGPVSSMKVGSLGPKMMMGGLRCSGFQFSLISYAMVRYVVENIPIALIHTDGQNQARISIKNQGGVIVSTGTDIRLDFQNFGFIFGETNESIPFYVQVNETTNLKPGVYRGEMKLRWYYAIPVFSGLSREVSEGLSVGFTIVGFPLNIETWGSGELSNIPITLTVEEDCNINAQNINFGTAPLVSKFNPVTGTVQITCSAQTPYTVGLSDGQNYNQNRRMKNLSSNNYLPYEIYKNTTTERWGYLGTERWLSENASQNPGIYDGSATQGYAYTAKIIDDGSNSSVEGTYKDNLILEVAF